jgi:transcriptional regulator with XRE-family HTH domain
VHISQVDALALSRGRRVSESAREEGAVFGPHLCELRVARGLTQAELAERARSNTIFVSRLERGVTTPTLGMLLRLAEGLDCRLYDLVEVFDRGPRISPRSRKE